MFVHLTLDVKYDNPVLSLIDNEIMEYHIRPLDGQVLDLMNALKTALHRDNSVASHCSGMSLDKAASSAPGVIPAATSSRTSELQLEQADHKNYYVPEEPRQEHSGQLYELAAYLPTWHGDKITAYVTRDKEDIALLIYNDKMPASEPIFFEDCLDAIVNYAINTQIKLNFFKLDMQKALHGKLSQTVQGRLLLRTPTDEESKSMKVTYMRTLLSPPGQPLAEYGTLFSPHLDSSSSEQSSPVVESPVSAIQKPSEPKPKRGRKAATGNVNVPLVKRAKAYAFVYQPFFTKDLELDANITDTETPILGYLNGFITYLIRKMKSRNVTSVLVRPETMEFGNPNETGHYDGIYGLLQRDEADVSMGPLAMNTIESVHYANGIRQTSAAVLQSSNLTVTEVDFVQQLVFAYSIGSVLLIILTVLVTVILINSMQVLQKKSSGSINSKPTSFSIWQVVTTLVNQQEYDPMDKLRRCVFIMYLILTFIVLSVALNDVGTKLVVTESNTARSLQDLYDADPSTGFYLIKEDWTTSKFRDVNMKKANQVYVKHCESRQSQCSLSHFNMLKMYADIATSSYKIVSDESASNMLSRFFCGTSRSLDSKHDQFTITKLDDMTSPGAVAFNARLSMAYREIINSAAMRILETGLVTEGLYRRAIDADDEILYSWRSCTMTDPLDDRDEQVRKVTLGNFTWVAKISAVALICATMLNILDNFLFKQRNRSICRKKGRRLHITRRFRVTQNRIILLSSTAFGQHR
ncbi:hypothetical protein HDE_02278 [Halotydeus destructor]|nr:hypothetical protein HDE_02278 [Halotydeus destructor]